MFLSFNKSISTNAIKSPQYILLIDDNSKLRSLLARYILLSCSQHQKSCILYQLSETGEPILTYAHDPQADAATELSKMNALYSVGETKVGQSAVFNPLESDFVIYEAAFPRQAVAWLNQLQTVKVSLPRRLTIISDVMMPGDTQVGLGGLLTRLAQWQMPLNLLFMSSEPQGYWLAKNLLGGVKPYFLVKGSANFNRLPQALVEGANRFTYQLLPRQTYSNLVRIKAA